METFEQRMRDEQQSNPTVTANPMLLARGRRPARN